VTLTVTDALGRSVTASRSVDRRPAAPAEVVASITPRSPYTAPVTLTFAATVNGGLGRIRTRGRPHRSARGATYVGPSNTASVRFKKHFRSESPTPASRHGADSLCLHVRLAR